MVVQLGAGSPDAQDVRNRRVGETDIPGYLPVSLSPSRLRRSTSALTGSGILVRVFLICSGWPSGHYPPHSCRRCPGSGLESCQQAGGLVCVRCPQ